MSRASAKEAAGSTQMGKPFSSTRQRSQPAAQPVRESARRTPPAPSAPTKRPAPRRGSYQPESLAERWSQPRENVGIGDMSFMKDEGLITTHGLGSCVAICIYDEQIKLGGLIHLMLPDSKLNKAKAEKNPLLFVDTGVEAFVRAFTRRGGSISRSVIKIAGGASSLMGEDLFHIGKRNTVNVRKMLWRHRLNIQSEDTGGTDSRTMMMDVTDGAVLVKVPGQKPRSL